QKVYQSSFRASDWLAYLRPASKSFFVSSMKRAALAYERHAPSSSLMLACTCCAVFAEMGREARRFSHSRSRDVRSELKSENRNGRRSRWGATLGRTRTRIGGGSAPVAPAATAAWSPVLTSRNVHASLPGIADSR